MKIAMVGHKVVPSRRGGIENVLTSLCPLLVERGAEVTCYNRSSDKHENEHAAMVSGGRYKGVKLKNAPTVKGRGLSALLASYSASVMAAFSDADIVHFHAEGPCAAMWIPKLFGKKCVATVHGLDWQREKWGNGFAARYIKYGEKALAKHADEIIVLSQNALDYFKATYNRGSVIIPNGIERPQRREADKITELFGLEKDGYICIISRLTAEKGIHYLIDAYNSISTDKKLVIAGDTSDTDEYVEFIKSKAASNHDIIFTGFISGDLLDEMYSNAYLVCLPSDIEGMSLSLLEALAYKNALLCSDIPENTAVAENHAVYFKKGDTKDLTEKLQRLCDNPQFVNEFKKDAADFILKKYNWNDVADATLAIYKEVFENKRKDCVAYEH